MDIKDSPLVSGAPAQRSGPHTSQSCCARALGRGCLTAAKTALRQAEAGCKPRVRCKHGRSGSGLAAYFRRSSAGHRKAVALVKTLRCGRLTAAKTAVRPCSQQCFSTRQVLLHINLGLYANHHDTVSIRWFL